MKQIYTGTSVKRLTVRQNEILEIYPGNLSVGLTDSGIKGTLSKFTDDTELCSAIMLWKEGMPPGETWTGWRDGTLQTS